MMSKPSPSQPDQQNLVVAVTPSKDRQNFLVRQYEAFWEPYLAYQKNHPDAPALKWIIVDETPTPCDFYKDAPKDGITYIHLPNRHDLSTVQEEFRPICEMCLYGEKELAEHVDWLTKNTRSDRYIVAHDPKIPSIGEMRNIGALVAHALYGHRDPNAAIFAKDDDDFSHVKAIPEMYRTLQTSSFAKFGSMLVYGSIHQTWYEYTMNKQDEETHVIENNQHSVLPRYVVWDDKAQTRENPYKHLGIYGCSFTYRLDKAIEIAMQDLQKHGKAGPFAPLSRREDVAFVDRMIEAEGLDKLVVIDNPVDWMVRIVHNNATRTMHHGLVDAAHVLNETVQYVGTLCGTKQDGAAPAVGHTEVADAPVRKRAAADFSIS